MGTLKDFIDALGEIFKPQRFLSALDASEKMRNKITGLVKSSKKYKISILDIGMGESDFAKELLQECGNVIYYGVDVERSVIRKATEKLRKFCSRAILAEGSMEDLGSVGVLKDKTFDFIFLFEVLCFVEPGRPERYNKMRNIFKNLAGRLGEKGIFVIIDNDAAQVSIPAGDFDAIDVNRLLTVLDGLNFGVGTFAPLSEWSGDAHEQVKSRFVVIARKRKSLF